MALETRVVTLPLSGALSEGVAARIAPNGALAVLENFEFLKHGQIRNRRGLSFAFDTSVDIDAIATIRDELIGMDGSKLYTLKDTGDDWVEMGDIVPLEVRARKLQANNGTVAHTALHTLRDIFYAGFISDGGVALDAHGLSVFDVANNAPLVVQDTTARTGTTTFPYVMFRLGTGTATEVAVVFNHSNDNQIKFVTYNAATDTWGTPQNLYATAATTNPFFAANWSTSHFVFAYRDTASFDVVVQLINKSTGAVEDTHTNSATAALTFPLAVTVSDDLTSVYVAWHETAGQVALSRYTITGTTLSFEWTRTIDNSALPRRAITIGVGSSNDAIVFTTVTDADQKDRYVRWSRYDTDGNVVTGASAFLYGCGLASHAFTYNSKVCVAVGYSGDNQPYAQPTLFLTNEDKAIVSRIFGGSGLGGGIYLPLPAQRQSDEFIIVLPKAVAQRLGSVGRLYESHVLTFDFSSSTVNAVEVNGSLVIGAGALIVYDGARVFEAGFHVYPEELTVTASAGAGLDDGDYQVAATYFFMDDQGNAYHSAPAPAVSVTLSGGNNQIAVEVPTCRLSSKRWTGVAVYVTGTDGSTFRSSIMLDNSLVTDRASTTITAAPTGIFLYTDSGEVENIAPPAPYYLSTDGNRVMLIPADDREKIWISKPVQEGRALEFHDLAPFVRRIPTGKPIVAIEPMDGNWVVWLEDEIRAFGGPGPNALGQGGYSTDRLITGDVGCTDRNSIVRLPEGYIFKGQKGFYLLSRSLTYSYIGDGVEDSNSLDVVDAVLLVDDDRSQVRFVMSDGSVLVFDYLKKRWSHFTDAKTFVAVEKWQGTRLVYLDDAGDVYEENSASRSETAVVETHWLKFNGLQGFNRLHWIHLLGDYRDTTVKLYFDGDDSSPAETIELLERGRIMPARQHFESLKIRIETTATTEISFEALSFEMGVEPKLYRLNYAVGETF